MEYRQTCGVALTLLVGLVGCNGPLGTPQEPLRGQAYLDAPLDSAKVVFQTPAGDPVATAADTVTAQGRFFEQLTLTPPDSGQYASWFVSTLPLTVRVTGGTAAGVAFDGTLLGDVDSFAPTRTVHVNILTTLILKYQKAAGVSPEQAAAAVCTALGIPAELNLAEKLSDPNYWFLFNPQRFMALAKANGGFDAFTDKVVASLVSTRKPGFNFVTAGEAAPTVGSSIGGKFLESIGDGLVAWGVSEAMGWVLNAFGIQDPTAQALSQIETQLTTINNTLTQINSQLSTLTNEVGELMQTVNLEWSNLIATYDSMQMSGPEGIIQNQYTNLLTYNATNASLCTPTGNALAAGFASDIQSASAYDIDQQIYDMYQNITGQIVGSNGALYDLTTQLIVQIQGGQDPLNCYYVLENYFGQLAAIQCQGLDLMIEAIHQSLPPPSTDNGLTVFNGTATDYYNKFTGQMDQEVELFLYNVDRLIVAATDVRSELAQKFSYLPTEAATIYSRADFVASQLSTQQPSGLIVRLIGDPSSVSSWITNNKIQVNGQNFTVVSVDNNTISNYPAALPASTPKGVSYYLTWKPNSGSFFFKTETNVSVVKLQFPATTAGSYTVTTPTQSQTLTVAMLNGNFQPASATDSPQIAYGSGVFYVRTLPTWQAGNAVQSNNTDNQWKSSWTTNLPDAAMTLNSVQNNPQTLMGSCPVTYYGQILNTFINSETANMNLAFSWNAAENTSTTWTPGSGYPSISSNQSLTCQSNTQTAKNNTTTTSSSFTFAPSTAINVVYQAEHVVTGSTIYNNYVRETFSVTTDAGLNSLEVVPQP